MSATSSNGGEELVPSTPTVIVIDFRIDIVAHKSIIFSGTDLPGKCEVTFEKWLID